jgi:hypothetical protein
MPSPEHMAVLTSKYWGPAGVVLSVSFMDNPTAGLKSKLLAHMNSWGKYCNVEFSETAGTGQVRITRAASGHWSYLGVDILQIPKNQPTMNLQGFTERTSETEFTRVVRHETGHTLGAPHEHMRRALVARIDPQKAIAYFARTQGWDEQMVRQQVLTPIEETSILGTESADQNSIMCYQLPGSITRDGKPITGGSDIDEDDAKFMAKIYPLPNQPPPPPPPTSSRDLKLEMDTTAKKIILTSPTGYEVITK